MSDPGAPPVGEVVVVPDWAKPLPAIDGINRVYWAAAREGRLLVQECPTCRHRQWYPRALCTACGGDPGWRETSGRGLVHTFTVIRQMGLPGFAAEVPYVVCLVDLPEGPRVFGAMPGVDPALVRIGLPVEVWFAAAADDVGVPCWRPATV